MEATGKTTMFSVEEDHGKSKRTKLASLMLTGIVILAWQDAKACKLAIYERAGWSITKHGL